MTSQYVELARLMELAEGRGQVTSVEAQAMALSCIRARQGFATETTKSPPGEMFRAYGDLILSNDALKREVAELRALVGSAPVKYADDVSKRLERLEAEMKAVQTSRPANVPPAPSRLPGMPMPMGQRKS